MAQLPAVATITEDGLGFPVPKPVDSLTPVDGFRSYDSLRMRFDDLWIQFEHIDRETVGTSFHGRDIFAYRFSRETDQTPEGILKPAAVLAGTVHSDEWAATEVVVAIFEWLALETEADPVATYLVENLVIVVHPLTNPDGFVHTQTYYDKVVVDNDRNDGPGGWGFDGRQRRKNMRDVDVLLETFNDYRLGVDLNRNHPPAFAGSSTPQSGTYRGESPGSEPESQALYAAADYAQVGGEDRIRFFHDTHSFGQELWVIRDPSAARNLIAERLQDVMIEASASVNGRRYRDRCAGATCTGQQGQHTEELGSTDEYFLATYACLSYTTEIPPTRDSGRSGHIFPDAQIDGVRQELVEADRAALYYAAGPPALTEIVVYDEAAIGAEDPRPRYHEKRLYSVETETRHVETLASASLQAGDTYVVVLRFNKPMRLLDPETGEAVVLPGQTDIAPEVFLGALATGEGPQWVFDQAGEPLGYLRYPGDTLRVRLELTSEATCAGAQELSVLTGDLVGQLLDANPLSVVDWSRDGWVHYEDHEGVEGIVGGADLLTEVVVEGAARCDVTFLRGDCDSDGEACSGVNDALTLLGWLFRGDTRPPCVAACDSNGDGETELTDAIYGLDYCFKGNAPPPVPFPECGLGTESDVTLGCEMPPESCH